MSMPNYSSSGASMMGGLQNSMADVTSSIGFWSNSGTGTGLQSFAGMGDAGALGGYQGVGVGNPMDSAAAAAATSMLGLTYATAGMVNPQGADAMMGATEEQKVSMMLMMSNGGAMGDGTTQGDGMNGGINPAANRALVGGQQPPLPPNPAGEKSGRKKGKNKKADDPALPPPPPPPDSAAANALMFNMMAAAAVSGGGADPLGFAAGMVPGFDASAMSNIPMPPPLMGSSDGGESGRAGGSSRSGRSGRRSPNFNSSTSGSYRRVARSSRPSDNDHKRNNNGDTKKADSGGGEDMEGVEGPDITGTDDLAEGVIKFRNATVYPPPPNFTAPLRERPASCRTIFVGGVPEKCTEDILREVFENCGEIQTCRVRASKGFAHIRFLLHEAVDRAMYFTGYRLAVNNKMDKEHSNRLHIDYAKDRDDVLEWETQQKALRDVRAAAVTTITIPTPTMPSRVDAPSPPKSVRYSEREASSLLEQLKQPETFTPSTSVLQTWLDRGDCSKRTCAQFYSMIGAVNAHIRRLTGERESAQSEMNAFREKHKLVLQIIMSQLLGQQCLEAHDEADDSPHQRRQNL